MNSGKMYSGTEVKNNLITPSQRQNKNCATLSDSYALSEGSINIIFPLLIDTLGRPNLYT
jgi:hypothetical protein